MIQWEWVAVVAVLGVAVGSAVAVWIAPCERRGRVEPWGVPQATPSLKPRARERVVKMVPHECGSYAFEDAPFCHHCGKPTSRVARRRA